MEEWDVAKVQQFLKQECQFDDEVCENFQREKIDGEVLASCENVGDILDLVKELETGLAKKLLIRLNKTKKTEELVISSSKPHGYSPARQFGESAGTVKYFEGTYLVDFNGEKLYESGPQISNLLHPVREFKEFQEITQRELDSFFFQALKFALACVNSRTNGTIHFGFMDKSVDVIGCSLTACTPPDLTDRLKQRIQRLLSPAEANIFRHCLHNPKFIEVHNFQGNTGKYMIDIDIEPKHEFIQETYIEVELSQLFQRRQNKRDDKLELFIRDATGSKRLQRTERQMFIDKTLKTLSNQRKYADAPAVTNKRLALEGMLKDGKEDPFDSSTFLVLVLDKQSELDVGLEEQELQDGLSFIGKYCKWRIVIDLNTNTKFRELYSNYHNTTHMTIDRFRECSTQIESITDRTWWIHANGCDEMKQPIYDLSKWEEQREEVVIALISQVRYMSLPHRCLAVFLFFNDNSAILTSIYKRFSNSKFCRVVFIAEYDSALENLRDKMPKESIRLGTNGMIGLPWRLVDNIFRTVSGQPDPECQIATSCGALVQVKRENWSDLEMLGATECRDAQENLSNKLRQQQYWKERLKFYSGNKVTWLNCALSPDFRERKDRHIIKRDAHEKLHSMIRECKYRGKNFEVFTVYHHAGAGGSTLARHVLWDLRESYKCTIIKVISNETRSQIEEVYHYGEEGLPVESLRPVVVVLDLPDQELCRIFLSELNKHKKNSQLVSIVIHCARTTEVGLDSPILNARFSHQSDVLLLQKFSSTEKVQFDEVLKMISTHEYLSVEADLMLGFMALTANNLDTYIRDVIRRHLRSAVDWELQLLKAIALLNTYYPDDPDVPTAFFDFLIPKDYISLVHWAGFSNAISLFCTVTDFKSSLGTAHCFRIKMYPLFAKELLEQLRAKRKLSSTVLEFLNSPGFRSHSYTREHLIQMTTKMVRRSRITSTHQPKNTSLPIPEREFTRYSDLINDILAEEKALSDDKSEYWTDAVNVAKTAFEVLVTKGFQKDPFLAQLVARILYLEARQFEEAIKYAGIANDIRPNHSFLLDTMGQIYKEKLRNILTPSVTVKSLSDFSNVIHLARNALRWFNLSVRANENEREVNYSPFIGQVEIYKTMYELLITSECLAGLKGSEELQTYLTSNDYVPAELSIKWRDHHEFMKALCKECESSLTTSLDLLTMIKPVKETQEPHHRLHQETLIKRVMECYYTYRDFLGHNDMPIEIQNDVYLKQAWSRNKVTQLGGLNFYTIMELGNEPKDGVPRLLEMKTLLVENYVTSVVYQKTDIEKLLLVSLSLIACGYDKGHDNLLELNFLCARYQNMPGANLNLYNLVMSMLLWPQYDMRGIKYNDEVFRHVLGKLKSENELVRRSRTEFAGENELQTYLRTARRKVNYKMRAVFYLSNQQSTLQKFVYKKFVTVDERLSTDDEFWKHPSLEKMLTRVHGENSGQYVKAFNAQTNDYSIKVPIAHTSSLRSLENEELVQFYIGFTWDGPVACGVGPIKKNTLPQLIRTQHQN